MYGAFQNDDEIDYPKLIHRAHNQWATQRAEWQKKINGVEGQMKEHLESLRAETDHQQNLQNTVEVKLSEKTQLEMEEKALLRQLRKYLFSVFVDYLIARW